MWIDLTGKHLKLHFLLLCVKLLLLDLLVHHITHQQTDILHHLLQLCVKLTDLIVTLDPLHLIIFSLRYMMHLNPELEHTITVGSRKCKDQQRRDDHSDNLRNKCLHTDLVDLRHDILIILNTDHRIIIIRAIHLQTLV